MKKYLLSLGLSLGILFGTSALLVPALAQESLKVGVTQNAASSASESAVTTAAAPEAATGGEILINGIEMVNMLLALAAIVLLLIVIRQFGTSTLSTIFGYFVVGTLMLASARLFILFCSLGIFDVSGETVNLGWHLIFYLAMITFFIAGMGFKKLGADNAVQEGFSKVLGWGLLCVILTVVIFVLAPIYDKPFTAMFAGSAADHIGVLHFIAFILGGIAAFYLFKKSSLGQITSMLALPYLVSFGLFALNHVWELFVESWQIIHVSGATGEKVEQLFVLPAFLLITYSYIRLWSLTRPRA